MPAMAQPAHGQQKTPAKPKAALATDKSLRPDWRFASRSENEVRKAHWHYQSAFKVTCERSKPQHVAFGGCPWSDAFQAGPGRPRRRHLWRTWHFRLCRVEEFTRRPATPKASGRPPVVRTVITHGLSDHIVRGDCAELNSDHQSRHQCPPEPDPLLIHEALRFSAHS